jgi:peptidylprolyl isomerase
MSISKPEVDFPDGAPPAELEITDIRPGGGKTAKAGDTVRVHYVGVAFSTGEEFDASWNRGEPLSFRLGAGQVISGWDQGIAGMKVGGRRKLVIPPHLGYGDRGAGGSIKPGETLIFICDLVSA